MTLKPHSKEGEARMPVRSHIKEGVLQETAHKTLYQERRKTKVHVKSHSKEGVMQEMACETVEQERSNERVPVKLHTRNSSPRKV